jgi:hypothetical protein
MDIVYANLVDSLKDLPPKNIAEEVVGWVLSHTETFIVSNWTDAYVKLDVLQICAILYITLPEPRILSRILCLAYGCN